MSTFDFHFKSAKLAFKVKNKKVLVILLFERVLSTICSVEK